MSDPRDGDERPMRRTDRLFTALAEAQDAHLLERAADSELARAATEAMLRTVAARPPGAPARGRRLVIGLSVAAGAALMAGVWLLVPGLRGSERPAQPAPLAARSADLEALAARAGEPEIAPAAAPLSFVVGEDRPGAVAAPLQAGRLALPLRFSDGSSVTLQPGARARVGRLTGQGAEVALDAGGLAVFVNHAADTRWQVQAGPFRVRVTGTRFDVAWTPDGGDLAVALHEGSVVIAGALLGEGVPLRAGQRLRVSLATNQIRTDSLLIPPRPAKRGEVAEPVIPPRPAKRGEVAEPAGSAGEGSGSAGEGSAAASASPAAPDWRALAERGDHAAALAAAERQGIPRLASTLEAGDLLRLGDVARYAGAPGHAHRLFSALVQRYPRDPRAGDALFSLGRLESEAGWPRASAWFARYLRDWPDGPLAAQAKARLAELAASPR